MRAPSLDPYLTAKDLARTMGVSVRTVRHWWQRLNVPPTIPAHACNRWSPNDAKRLLKAWAQFWKDKNGQQLTTQ